MAAVFSTIVLLAGCGVGLTPPVSAPRNVVASTSEVNQITVQWDEVPGATRYFVYRGESSDAPVWTEGENGPVPFAATNVATFVDTSVAAADRSDFYYQVTAVAEYRDEESAPSDPVLGRWVDGPNEWQAGTIVGTALSSTFTLTADPANSFARPWVLTVPTDAGAAVTVRRVNPDGTLTVVGDAFGLVDGSVGQTAALAVYDGDARVALVAENTGVVEVYAYDETSGAFELEQSLADVGITGDSPLVGFAARSHDDYRLAYRAADGAFRLLRYDPATGATPETPPALLDTNTTDAILTQLKVTASADRVGIVYEIEDGAGNTIESGVSVWEAGTWSTAQSLGTDVEHLHLTLDRNDGSVWVIVVTSSSLFLNDETATLDLELTPALLGSTPLAGAPAAIAASGGEVSLFYVDDDAGAGAIRSSTAPFTTWTLQSPATFTIGTGIANLALLAPEDRLFAGYTLTGLGFVRAFQ